MTDDEFKQELESGLKNTIDGEPYIKEKLLLYLKHKKESKTKGLKPKSSIFVEGLLEKAFPDKWTPRRTAIKSWINKMEKPQEGKHGK